MASSDEQERPRGILTRKDRAVLRGEADDLTDNAVRNRFHNMRSRIENGMLDFIDLDQSLPRTDVRQVFEPAYQWSREKRKLREQGRTADPKLGPFLQAWLSAFRFYSYGMYAGGIGETEFLLRGLVENGLEQGCRELQFQTNNTYRPVEVSVNVSLSQEMSQQEYLEDIRGSLPRDASKAARRIIELSRRRMIPHETAEKWLRQLDVDLGI